ncbi:MAG TPA: nitrophenyl compound nitroreductase subunit ArsF family protein, partial [Candidatus Paceibacterota bacterium]|nr:nitrophenyl compound nitroreductase subunit ArsF family protein [Candidatus Paceibacterota bacterium]
MKLAVVAVVAAAAVAAFALKGNRAARISPSKNAEVSRGTNPAPQQMTAKLPKLLDLGADKCVPCKMMAPILKELKEEYAGRMNVEFIDVWQNPDAGKQYGIEIIPTQIFYDAEGKELFRHVGFFAKADILAKWQELGVDLSGKAINAEVLNQVTAFYFHGTVRCETCLAIELLAKQAVQRRFALELADKRLVFASINYDEPENQHYREQYKLPHPSL